LLGFGKKTTASKARWPKNKHQTVMINHDKSKWVLECSGQVAPGLQTLCRGQLQFASEEWIIFDSDLCQGANGTTNSDGGGVATWMKLASRCKRCHKFEQFWVLTSFRRCGSTVVHSFKCQTYRSYRKGTSFSFEPLDLSLLNSHMCWSVGDLVPLVYGCESRECCPCARLGSETRLIKSHSSAQRFALIQPV
jgi:hypothetical protein